MIRIIQIRSTIGCISKQKKTLIGLGLRRIGSSVKRIDTSSIRGMINLVSHLIKVQKEGDIKG